MLRQGYQRHVLGYTVAAVLDAVNSKCGEFVLDTSVEMLLPIILDDVFGTVSSEKEIAAISKSKECRRTQSFFSIRILCEKSTTFQKILDVIEQYCSTEIVMNSRNLSRLDQLLRQAVSGLLHNTMIERKDLWILCFTRLKSLIVAESNIMNTNAVVAQKTSKELAIEVCSCLSCFHHVLGERQVTYC